MSYFSDIYLKFSWGNSTTSWWPLEKRIIICCTISVVLVVIGMNMIITAAEREIRGPKTASWIRLLSNRGLMDDMTVTTETHIQARWIFRGLDETAKWANMTYKPWKSRGVVIRKGKVTNMFKLFILEEEIHSHTNNPIKCMGKWFDSTLKDKTSQDRLQQQVQEGLSRIDKSGLPEKCKVWTYQQGLLPRLVWPLMVYEASVSCVERLEKSYQQENEEMVRTFSTVHYHRAVAVWENCHLPLWLRSTRWQRTDFFSNWEIPQMRRLVRHQR